MEKWKLEEWKVKECRVVEGGEEKGVEHGGVDDVEGKREESRSFFPLFPGSVLYFSFFFQTECNIFPFFSRLNEIFSFFPG